MAKLVVVGEVLILYRMVSESKSFPVTVNIEPDFRVVIALAVPVAGRLVSVGGLFSWMSTWIVFDVERPLGESVQVTVRV